jgi:hypothetical protein
MGYDDFRVSVLMNLVAYTKRLRNISGKMSFNIGLLLLIKSHLVSGLPDMQYFPVTVIGN